MKDSLCRGGTARMAFSKNRIWRSESPIGRDVMSKPLFIGLAPVECVVVVDIHNVYVADLLHQNFCLLPASGMLLADADDACCRLALNCDPGVGAVAHLITPRNRLRRPWLCLPRGV